MMKGAIVACLGALVQEKFGKDKWEEALEKAGLNRRAVFLAFQDVDDKTVLQIIEAVCKVLNISPVQAADAFGEYWVNVYAPKTYRVYYIGVNSARDFLLKMDEVHATIVKKIRNAQPPRFEYKWLDDKTLIMKYKSRRGLIDFLVGLIKGVGKYYKEDLRVTKLGNDRVKIIFP